MRLHAVYKGLYIFLFYMVCGGGPSWGQSLFPNKGVFIPDIQAVQVGDRSVQIDYSVLSELFSNVTIRAEGSANGADWLGLTQVSGDVGENIPASISPAIDKQLIWEAPNEPNALWPKELFPNARVRLVAEFPLAAPDLVVVPSIYPGDDGGAGCGAATNQSAIGVALTPTMPFTLCFAISNTGETSIGDLSVFEDPDSTTLESAFARGIEGVLDPGQRVVVPVVVQLAGTTMFTPFVSGRPVDPAGGRLSSYKRFATPLPSAFASLVATVERPDLRMDVASATRTIQNSTEIRGTLFVDLAPVEVPILTTPDGRGELDASFVRQALLSDGSTQALLNEPLCLTPISSSAGEILPGRLTAGRYEFVAEINTGDFAFNQIDVEIDPLNTIVEPLESNNRASLLLGSSPDLELHDLSVARLSGSTVAVNGVIENTGNGIAQFDRLEWSTRYLFFTPQGNRTISGVVWLDANRDSMPDEISTTGLQAAQVFAYRLSGEFLAAASTDAMGRFLLEGLPSETIEIQLDQQAVPNPLRHTSNSFVRVVALDGGNITDADFPLVQADTGVCVGAEAWGPARGVNLSSSPVQAGSTGVFGFGDPIGSVLLQPGDQIPFQVLSDSPAPPVLASGPLAGLLALQLDPENSFTETPLDTAGSQNNQSAILVPAGLLGDPDLVIDSVLLISSGADSVELDVTLRNAGSFPADLAGGLSWSSSFTTVSGSSVAGNSGAVSGLPLSLDPGSLTNFVITAMAIRPGFVSNCVSAVGIEVDSVNAVAELDELNNGLTTVLPGLFCLPDLEVALVSATRTIENNTLISGTLRVHTAPAESLPLVPESNDQGELDASFVRLTTTLAGGGERVQSESLCLTTEQGGIQASRLSTGLYEFATVVNSDGVAFDQIAFEVNIANTLSEQSLANNFDVLALVSSPDLEFQELSLRRISGEALAITGFITNSGNAAVRIDSLPWETRYELFSVSGNQSLDGVVWRDENGNSLPDEDLEASGISGAILYAYEASGEIVAAAETDTMGQYILEGLPLGEHRIELDLQTIPPDLRSSSNVFSRTITLITGEASVVNFELVEGAEGVCSIEEGWTPAVGARFVNLQAGTTGVFSFAAEQAILQPGERVPFELLSPPPPPPFPGAGPLAGLLALQLDPANAVSETPLATPGAQNNQSSILVPVGLLGDPDLVIDSMILISSGPDSVELDVTLRNAGSFPADLSGGLSWSSSFTSTSSDLISGSNGVSLGLPASLEPGATASFRVNAMAIGPPYVISNCVTAVRIEVDSANTVVELDEINNMASLIALPNLFCLPDLEIDLLSATRTIENKGSSANCVKRLDILQILSFLCRPEI